MNFSNVLVTGGAGFVGSNLCVRLKQAFEGLRVRAFDNLLRRGSELNLGRLQAAGVEFVHGDVRCPEDLERQGPFDLLVDCAAEPSVHAGLDGSPATVLRTNLVGTLHCFEAARQHGAAVLFLSTSRVYSIDALRALTFSEGESRFVLDDVQEQPGCSGAGVNEDFSLADARSFYGTAKLAGEMVLQEYVRAYQVPGLIYRCGVLAGPWQMGRVDQGFLSLWVLRHCFQQPLRYIGFGGNGKQVRDVLHVDDLVDLVLLHLDDLAAWDGRVYTVGGGREVSTSLLELTQLCQQETGRRVSVTPHPETSPVDVPVYISDCSRLRRDTGWKPRRQLADVVHDTSRWVRDNEDVLRHGLA